MRRRDWLQMLAWCRQSVACLLTLLMVLVLVPPMPAQAAIGAVWNGSKTVAPSIATPNSKVTYTVTVSNAGDDKDHVQAIDTLPAGFTYLASGGLSAGTTTLARYENANGTAGPLTGSGAVTPTRTVVGGRDQLTYPKVNNFQPGWVYIYTITVNVPAGTVDGAYGNDLYVDGQAGGINRDVDLQDTAIVTIGSPPVIELSKVTSPAGPVTIAENSTILYQITAKNTGAGAATNLRIIDTLPATFTYDGTYTSTYSLNGGPATPITPTVAGTQATWTFASLAGSSSTLVITFRAISGTGVAARGTWNNLVSSQANNAVDASSGGTAPVTVVTPIIPTVTKAITSANQAGPPYNGTTGNLRLTYTITITNPSGATAQNLKVVDDLPGLTGWTYQAGSSNQGNPDVVGNQLVWEDIGNLAAGASTTVTFTLLAPANQAGTFNDTVTVSGPNIQTVTTGPTAPAALSGPTYSITKTASISTGTAGINNDFIYTIEITNTGNATGTYRVTDILPNNTTMLTWSTGPTRYFEYDSNIAGGAAATTVATAPTGYPGTGGATMTFPTTGGSYSIAAGITDRIRFRARLNTSVDGVYFNQAAVADTSFISGGAATGLTAPITIGMPPSMTISKSVDQSLVLPLDPVHYTVRVSNNSASATAYNVDVSDALPSGFNYQPGSSQLSINGGVFGALGNPTNTFGTIAWNNVVASLAPGQYVDVRFRVQVSNLPGSYDNVASTAGDNFGNTSTGGTATVVVGNPPTLTISKSHNQAAPIPLGNQVDVQYTITVNNTGSLAATSVTITDTLPAGTTYQLGTSALNTGAGFAATGDPSGTSGTITWAGLSNIAAGGSAILRFTVRFPNTMASGSYPNYASASGTNVSVVSTGPTAPVTVGNPPNVSISSAILTGTTVTAPATVRYRITISNAAGAGPAQLSVVNAILPQGMSYVGGSSSWGGAVASGPLVPTQTGSDPMTLQWQFAAPFVLNAGQTATLQYDVQVLATAVAATGAGQGYFVESQTIGNNYGLITTGVPPGAASAGSTSPPALQVSSSSSVGLSNLIAVARPDGVTLHWQTGSEWQNLGFVASRSDKPNGTYTPLTALPLSGLGDSQIGGVYHLSDTQVVPGETYYYQLESTEFGGLRKTYGPLKVKVPTQGETTASLQHGPQAPQVPTAVPSVPTVPRTADVRSYLQVLAQDDTGITLRLVTPTVQLHSNGGTTQVIIDNLPLIHTAGQYRLPQAVVPLGLPADVPYSVTVLSATDAVRVGDVRPTVNDLPPLPNGGSGGSYVSSPTPPPITSSADPVATIIPPPTAAAPAPAPGGTSTSSGSTAKSLGQSHLQFAFGLLANVSGPAGLVDATETAQARNHRIVQLRLFPVQYDTEASRLTQYRDLTVRVAFQQPATLVTAGTARNRYDAAFDTLMAEYDLLSRWEAPPKPRTDDYQAFGGPAFRVTAPGEGLYQLTAAELTMAGVPLDEPQNLRLFHRHRELPLDVVMSGATLSALRFFAPANPTIYSHDTSLFLVADQVPGKRMAPWDASPGDLPAAELYQAEAVQATASHFWRQMPADGKSDYWFMDYLDLAFSNKPTTDVTFRLQGVSTAPDRSGWVEVGLRGEVKDPRVPLNNHVSVSINGRTVGDVQWSGTDYARRRFAVPPGLLNDGDNTVRLTLLNDRGAAVPVALVDSVALHYWRHWQAEQGRLMAKLPDPATASYAVSGLQAATAMVYDVTDPAAVRKAGGVSLADTVGFADPGTEGERRYWIGDATGLAQATLQPITTGPSLHDRQQADWLVITPAIFKTQAERLADYRALQGLRTRVVDLQQIYDEFAGGHPEPEAIRDFLAWTQSNWEAPAPAYAVLLGDGSFDYRNDYGDDPETLTAFVPPHLRPSLHIGLTPDDNWFASAVGDDELPDLFIGRLPAASLAEATTMVDKIIAFEGSTDAWRQQAVTVADNDDPTFRRMADSARLGYANVFGWQELAIGNAGSLSQALTDGTGLTFYVGHGSTDIWSDERVLTNDAVDALASTDKAGMVVAASCLTAYFHDPYLPSLGEALLRKPGGGAAAYLGGCGYTLPASQEIMTKRFFRYLLTDRMPIGAAMAMAKIGMFMDDAPLWREEIGSWTLLGDPAMTVVPTEVQQPPLR